jgi:hypothetical protein
MDLLSFTVFLTGKVSKKRGKIVEFVAEISREFHKRILRGKNTEHEPIVILGNKCDLAGEISLIFRGILLD